MELQLHQHFDTDMDHSCSLHKSYKPHSLLDWNRENDGSKKGAKVEGTRVTVFAESNTQPWAPWASTFLNGGQQYRGSRFAGWVCVVEACLQEGNHIKEQ